MRRRKICIVIACLSCFTFLTSSVALAKESIEVTNNINTGVIDIELDEYSISDNKELVPWQDGAIVLPGDTLSKIPRISNIGYDCYIRAKMGFSLDDLENSYYGMGENWIHAQDGYWYYTKILKSGEYADIFQGIKIPENLSQEYEDKEIQLKIDVDAIQTNNFIPDYESEKPWGDVNIQECIQEAPYVINKLNVENPKSFEIQYDKASKALLKNADDFFTNIPTLFPGDVYEDTLNLNNTSNNPLKLYFKTFSDDSDLLNKIKLKITLKDGSSEKIIYDGNLRSKDLENEILLTTISGNTTQQLIYSIEVPKELDNQYTLLQDKVRWMFSVEEVASDDSTSHSKPVKTGDYTDIILETSLLWVSLGAFALSSRELLKQRKEVKENNKTS